MRRRRRDKDWKDFADWCRGRGLQPLPAHPWTVAAYVRWCEARHNFQSIVKRLRTIAGVHLEEGERPPDRQPTVTRTMRSIEMRQLLKRRGSALFRAQDFVAEEAPPPPVPPSDTPPAGKPGTDESRRKRALRSTPRLVRRRPS